MARIVHSLPQLLLYNVMQIITAVTAKYGSLDAHRWLSCFIVVNIINAASVWVMMMMYKRMSANIVMALCLGTAFSGCQLAVALTFRQTLTPLQCAGIVVILGGLITISLGAPESAGPVEKSDERTDFHPVGVAEYEEAR